MRLFRASERRWNNRGQSTVEMIMLLMLSLALAVMLKKALFLPLMKGFQAKIEASLFKGDLHSFPVGK